MRIVTFNNRGTGHLVPTTRRGGVKRKTLCGRKIASVLDMPEIREPQEKDYHRGKHVLTHPADGKLYLCGRCESAVEAIGARQEH